MKISEICMIKICVFFLCQNAKRVRARHRGKKLFMIHILGRVNYVCTCTDKGPVIVYDLRVVDGVK